MTVWRIGGHANLDGGGGLRASARWHTRGRRIVYCAPNPAAALLEVLVHLEIDVSDLPVRYQYLEISIPEDIKRDRIGVDSIGAGWAADPTRSRRIGDEWLQSNRSAILLVPSALVPATDNVLLNPAHPEANKIRIARTYKEVVDLRLLG